MLAKLDNWKGIPLNMSPEITFPHAQKSPETEIPRLYSKNRQQITHCPLLITYYLLSQVWIFVIFWRNKSFFHTSYRRPSEKVHFGTCFIVSS